MFIFVKPQECIRGSCRVQCRRCLRPISFRPCTLSLQSCRGWRWSSSGFTGITFTEALCQARRIITGDRSSFFLCMPRLVIHCCKVTLLVCARYKSEPACSSPVFHFVVSSPWKHQSCKKTKKKGLIRNVTHPRFYFLSRLKKEGDKPS